MRGRVTPLAPVSIWLHVWCGLCVTLLIGCHREEGSVNQQALVRADHAQKPELQFELTEQLRSGSGTLDVSFEDGSTKLRATLAVARTMYVAWPGDLVLESTPTGLVSPAPESVTVNSVDLEQKGTVLTEDVKCRQLLKLAECNDGRYRVRLRYTDTSMNWYVAGIAPTSEFGEVNSEEFVLVVADGEGRFYHKTD